MQIISVAMLVFTSFTFMRIAGASTTYGGYWDHRVANRDVFAKKIDWLGPKTFDLSQPDQADMWHSTKENLGYAYIENESKLIYAWITNGSHVAKWTAEIKEESLQGLETAAALDEVDGRTGNNQAIAGDQDQARSGDKEQARSGEGDQAMTKKEGAGVFFFNRDYVLGERQEDTEKAADHLKVIPLAKKAI